MFPTIWRFFVIGFSKNSVIWLGLQAGWMSGMQDAGTAESNGTSDSKLIACLFICLFIINLFYYLFIQDTVK